MTEEITENTERKPVRCSDLPLSNFGLMERGSGKTAGTMPVRSTQAMTGRPSSVFSKSGASRSTRPPRR